MGKWLAAICKGLSAAAGPFGAFGEFALKLYDDERAEERDKKLKELITGGQHISREAVEQIFELKTDLTAIHEQFINGVTAIKELLAVKKISISTPEELETLLTERFIDDNSDIIRQKKLILQKQIKEEILKLYGSAGSFGRFLMLIEQAGFVTATLPSNAPMDVIVFEFLRGLERRTMFEKIIIFRELAKDSPASVVLMTALQLIKELAQLLAEEQKRNKKFIGDTGIKDGGSDISIEEMTQDPIVGVLFFDLKDYSKLNLDELEAYHEGVLNELYAIVIGNGRKNTDDYLCKNSWGDGIFLISRNYYRLVSVGLRLRDYFKDGEYRRVTVNGNVNLSLGEKDLLPRIAIHFGECKQCADNFKGGVTYYGPTLFLPARIEPITPPGRVWVTNRIKDFVEDKQGQTTIKGKKVKFIKQGCRKLAKDFGVEEIYEAYWDKEPKPLIFEEEEEEASNQIPEEYENIDGETAQRIEVLTKESPIKKKISVCSREPGYKKCPVKARSMQVISELSRSGESIAEDSKATFWITHIQEQVATIVNNRKSLTYDMLQILYYDIEGFFECLYSFDRENDTWPDGTIDNNWGKSYLYHRLKSHFADGGAYVDGFLMFVNEFKQYFDNEFKKSDEIDFEKRIHLPRDIYDALTRIQQYTVHIGNRLDSISKNRFNATKKSLRDAFKKFNRFKFARHMKTFSKTLSEEAGPLPPLWMVQK